MHFWSGSHSCLFHCYSLVSLSLYPHLPLPPFSSLLVLCGPGAAGCPACSVGHCWTTSEYRDWLQIQSSTFHPCKMQWACFLEGSQCISKEHAFVSTVHLTLWLCKAASGDYCCLAPLSSKGRLSQHSERAFVSGLSRAEWSRLLSNAALGCREAGDRIALEHY